MSGLHRRWLLMVGVLACNAGGSAGPDAAAPSAESACRELAEAGCARLAACDRGYFAFTYGDDTQCRALLAAGCPEALGLSGAASTTAVAGCASALPGLDCERIFEAHRGGSGWYATDFDYQAALEACGVKGALEDGSACGAGLQCRGGRCKGQRGTECGHCLTPVAEGGACEHPTIDDCALGLYCRTLNRMSPYIYRCTRYAPAGQMCSQLDQPNPSTSVGCQAGLHCSWSTGICRPLLGAGEACDDTGADAVCGSALACRDGRCVDIEAELRASGSKPIVPQSCTMSDPNPEFWTWCRFPATCVNNTRCEVVPPPTCGP
ncbi:MAG TPA: hypothetical protein VN914_06460 [Polyangia bacterium]|nr:hypothetical protein [Polyangia bacterium]